MRDIDVKKADLIQKLTIEFTLGNMADTLVALAGQDWGKLSPAEVLMIAAQRVRENANYNPVEVLVT
jgi:hypothetical protein